MNGTNPLITNLLPHFLLSFLTFLSTYLMFYLTLVSQECGRLTCWDNMADKLKAFITPQKLHISGNRKTVCVNGCLDNSYYSCITEFVNNYNLLIATRNKVHKVKNDFAHIIVLSFIISAAYATFIFSIGQGKISWSSAGTFFNPLILYFISFFAYFPILNAYNKVLTFTESMSTEYNEIQNDQGDFVELEKVLA